MKDKVAVMMLGYNTEKPNFRKVAWGSPPDKPGRLVTSVAVALREEAERLIIAMGAKGKDGRPGSVITEDLLFENIWQLSEFNIMRRILKEISVSQIEKSLQKIVEPFVSRVGTRFKFRDSAKSLYEEGFSRIIIVTSPDHMSRAVRDSFTEWLNPPFSLEFVPSSTLYSCEDGETPPERASMENVVVIEPPSPVGALAKKMLSAGPEVLTKIREILE
ncbi:MAG: hypothetical protein PHW72_03365 [Candidatus Pacebacteria bacterium]|nr:hypothetical protein [Candidatus Paceibacterota bacterium]